MLRRLQRGHNVAAGRTIVPKQFDNLYIYIYIYIYIYVLNRCAQKQIVVFQRISIFISSVGRNYLLEKSQQG
jgi:hypothetical protein